MGYVTSKGRQYEINGKVLELYSIGFLGSMIGKNPITLRKWEYAGWLPVAEYRDNSGRRLYTMDQIMSIRKILVEEAVKTGVAFLKTRFKQKAFEAFRQLKEQEAKNETGTNTEGAIAGSVAAS